MRQHIVNPLPSDMNKVPSDPNFGKKMFPGRKIASGAPKTDPVKGELPPDVAADMDPAAMFGPKAANALSVRLWIRGLAGVDEGQAFLKALGADAVRGLIDIKTANFLLNLYRTRLGMYLQTRAQGREFDIEPAMPAETREVEPDEDSKSSK